MEVKSYETVFIITPVLPDEQVKDTVDKFKKIITDQGGKIVHEEFWGLKKLAYPIKKKNTGFYALFEFKTNPENILNMDIEYRRDERVMRHLVVSLDKYGVAYNEKRRNKQAEQALESPIEDEEQN